MVVLDAELIVGAVVFTCEGRTAAEALASAVRASEEGARASVVLSPAELRGALEALDAVVAARAPILVHLAATRADKADGARRGRDELALASASGAGVLCAWSAQEAVDLTLAARRAAEDAETPFILAIDGAGPVMALPGAGLVEKFLGVRPKRAAESVRGGKRAERAFAARAQFALAGALRELGDLTGRPLGVLERYATADADEMLVAVGQAFPAARAVAEALRGAGRRVGVIGVRSLRPFYGGDLVKQIGRARGVLVLEPYDVALAPAGGLATELKAAFADALTWAPGFPGVGHIPTIVSAVFATIDGAVIEADVRAAHAELVVGDRARRIVVFGSDVQVG